MIQIPNVFQKHVTARLVVVSVHDVQNPDGPSDGSGKRKTKQCK